MPVLTTQQRSTLEKAVKDARRLAEAGARNALQGLAVDSPEPFAHMTTAQRMLRNSLRHKGRLLGDALGSTGPQEMNSICYELAYEYWHKMLFASFLEANGLLMHPDGVPVTMDECEELAKEEGHTDKWEAAANYASRMLPAIFRPEDPLMQIQFASNDRIKLEEILDSLEHYIFTADDALGWVYQFWQSDAKAAINASGDKIDGARLPAVTQLFTEPYMVHFLIDNTIGAWWVSRNPGAIPPVKFEYLRLLEDGTPAAGKFEGWPEKTSAISSLDPCMGSGHFVAALFGLMAPLRMMEEGLTKEEATDKVIAENLHGLELDPRCTQIAAFNLALTAWKFCGHYKPLPEMNLACSGVAPKGKVEDWVKLVKNENDPAKKLRLENGMRMLYEHFQLAPELGSLLDPTTIKADMYTASFEELQPVLKRALESEADTEQLERGVMASGIAKAGQLLAKKYIFQITNVPYLVRGKQDDILLNFALKNYANSKTDLSTIFIERMVKSLMPNGTASIVSPQNWLFLSTYKKFREAFIKSQTIHLIAQLGAGAFQEISGEFVKVILFNFSKTKPSTQNLIIGVESSSIKLAIDKDRFLISGQLLLLNQLNQLLNPDGRVILDRENNNLKLLNAYANSYIGMHVGDWDRFRRCIWELNLPSSEWAFLQNNVSNGFEYEGLDAIIYWPNNGKIHTDNPKARVQGKQGWGKNGVAISMMADLQSSLYKGTMLRNGVSAIIPINEKDLPAIWSYISSKQYVSDVRKIDPNLYVTNTTLIKVPFDLDYWQKVAAEKYPNGLPKPYSDDPTQWLFHGHPVPSENPLQVAFARLLGYRWPAETDTEMELADEAGKNIQDIKAFDDLTDEDGILCIPPVNGEAPAAEKLRAYLQAVYGTAWANNTLGQLLAQAGAKKSNLDDWLREEFFEQHYKLFQNRPFIWHIWDGRKDGFSVLVNYHKLDKEKLQRLIYTYLGDWIRQCEAKRKNGESGAEGLLSAALKLKEKLEAILEGESPYDIFVRWKPLAQQPVGWEPDLNDGVRLNIRPFIIADVLRKKPNIKWGIDRGKNPPGSYWGEIRDNDRHLTLEEKRK